MRSLNSSFVRWAQDHRDGLIVLGSFVASVFFGGVIIALFGADPIEAYRGMMIGALGDQDAVLATLAKWIPLLLATFSISVAFNGGMWNIGAEGQLYVGAFAATWVGLTFGGLPSVVMMPLALAFGLGAAALWAWIPAKLNLDNGLNIVVLTIMLNSLGVLATQALTVGPYAGKEVAAGATDRIPEAMRFAKLTDFSNLNTGAFLALAVILAVTVVMLFTVRGYDWRMCRLNGRFARYGGVNVRKVQMSAMLLSGLLAGLAGALLVMGEQYRFRTAISPGYTWTGMILAMMVAYHPVGGIGVSLIYAIMESGALEMELMTDVPVEVVQIVMCLAVLFVSAGFAIANRLASRLRED